jgi:hypothetical protein
MPEEKMYNNGSLGNALTWYFEKVTLPPLQKGSKFKILAKYDLKSGGVGFDNVRMSTQQRYLKESGSLHFFAVHFLRPNPDLLFKTSLELNTFFERVSQIRRARNTHYVNFKSALRVVSNPFL